MNKLFIFIFTLMFPYSINAQAVFVPNDLSYNFCITQASLDLKGNVKEIKQTISYSDDVGQIPQDWDENIYEEPFTQTSFQSPQVGTCYVLDNYYYPIVSRLQQNDYFCSFNTNKSIETVIIYPRKTMGDYRYMYKYDGTGNISSVSEVGSNGKVLNTFSFVYENGLLIKKNNESQFKKKLYPTEYKYDSERRVIEVVTNTTSKGKIKDAQNRTYEYTQTGNELTVNSTCKSSNNKEYWTSEWKYSADMAIKSYEICLMDKKGNLKEKKKYLYGKNHQIIKLEIQKELKMSMDNLLKTMGGQASDKTNVMYNYNSNDDIIEIITTSAGKSSLQSFEYEYDDIGNWTSRKNYLNGKFHSLVTREISYRRHTSSGFTLQ